MDIFSDVMKGMLRYAKSSENLVAKCLALADFCHVEMSSHLSEQTTRLSLQLGAMPTIEIIPSTDNIPDEGPPILGSGPICSYFVKWGVNSW